MANCGKLLHPKRSGRLPTRAQWKRGRKISSFSLTASSNFPIVSLPNSWGFGDWAEDTPNPVHRHTQFQIFPFHYLWRFRPTQNHIQLTHNPKSSSDLLTDHHIQRRYPSREQATPVDPKISFNNSSISHPSQPTFQIRQPIHNPTNTSTNPPSFYNHPLKLPSLTILHHLRYPINHRQVIQSTWIYWNFADPVSTTGNCFSPPLISPPCLNHLPSTQYLSPPIKDPKPPAQNPIPPHPSQSTPFFLTSTLMEVWLHVIINS